MGSWTEDCGRELKQSPALMSGAAARKDVAYLLLASCLGGVECKSKALSAPGCFNSGASRRRPSYHPTVGRMKVCRRPVTTLLERVDES